MFRHKQRKSNPWKGFTLGLIGGAAGVMAMDAFQTHISPMLMDRLSNADDEDEESSQTNQEPLDSIAVAGVHHKQDESSTAALGRIMYHWVSGHDPQAKESKSTLSYLVHWVYGIVQGGLYGAGSSMLKTPSLPGGMAFGAGLWLVGDELVVPMLGLQKGPTAYAFSTHANRFALHLVYGTVTGLTTGLLRRFL